MAGGGPEIAGNGCHELLLWSTLTICAPNTRQSRRSHTGPTIGIGLRLNRGSGPVTRLACEHLHKTLVIDYSL